MIKQTSAAELVLAIREVKNGNAYFSPAASHDTIETSLACVAEDPLTPDRFSSRDSSNNHGAAP